MSLADVMEVLEGPTQVQSNIARQTPVTRALQSVWNELADTQRTMLESTTFAIAANADRVVSTQRRKRRGGAGRTRTRKFCTFTLSRKSGGDGTIKPI